MKIGVLIKTVNYVHAQTGFDLKNNCIDPEDIVRMVNPLDEVALEWALKLKDAQHDVKVVAISLGGRYAEEGLRKSVAMGADQALHLQWEEPEKLDAAALSEILARTCKRENFDLILCGATAIDSNEGLEGPYLAERLAIPHLSSIVEISLIDGNRRLKVQRVVERGDRQLLECTLPALLTVQKGSVVPRYPTLAGFLRAEKSVVTAVQPESVGISAAGLVKCNLTETVGYCSPKPKKTRSVSPTPLSAAERVELMVNRDASRAKEGGMVVDGRSEEMFAHLTKVLEKAGVLKR